MRRVKRDWVLAQKAMGKLLVDLLSRDLRSAAGCVTHVTRVDSDCPCWYLWTDDNLGVFQVRLKDAGQVFCGKEADAYSSQEMEADFVIQYLPCSDVAAA